MWEKPAEDLGKTLANFGIDPGSRAPEIKETLEALWENVGMDGDGCWPVASARPSECPATGHDKLMQTLEDLRMSLGKPWEMVYDKNRK